MRAARQRGRDAPLDDAERIAELLGGVHLIHGLATSELHQMHPQRLRHRRAQLARFALLQHLIDEIVTHVRVPIRLGFMLPLGKVTLK